MFSEHVDKQIIRQDDRWIEFSSTDAEVRHSDIARLAYGIFEGRGREHGHDLEHWFEGEREALNRIGRQRK